ncbi:sirohydrochlorin chelatase [Psychromonas sp. Urea-02u-13]|uniref:sirohydrochlorin chelatase n=1 Tax=Psychromonas sp. Urea-02u-13 TaxID=2058326 RepID=UPI000C34CB96|nr:CbiX/SirB N-terminal domain-containing protein [Psychromonas sp. Urea-02u-13]PKG37159.1 cobalamin biosynthesis protein CbiX [Psychromonas sp. Urea-02u-13]
MKALLLIAHGSRREQSNQEVFTLVEQLKATHLAGYELYQAGFLEIAQPSILDAIESSVNEGASSVVLLPYFLNSGNHVVQDIPNIINQAKLKHPNLAIHVTEHVGASDLMLDLIVGLAKKS